jgi:U3 small nucleolar RNA-associated protein 6
LISYVTVLHEAINREISSDGANRLAARWMQEVGLIRRRYLTTGRVWQRLFEMIGDGRWEEGQERVLGAVYEGWRKQDAVGAAVSWAGWLTGRGRGREGRGVVEGAMRGLCGEERAEVERRWRGALDGRQAVGTVTITIL